MKAQSFRSKHGSTFLLITISLWRIDSAFAVGALFSRCLDYEYHVCIMMCKGRHPATTSCWSSVHRFHRAVYTKLFICYASLVTRSSSINLGLLLLDYLDISLGCLNFSYIFGNYCYHKVAKPVGTMNVAWNSSTNWNWQSSNIISFHWWCRKSTKIVTLTMGKRATWVDCKNKTSQCS